MRDLTRVHRVADRRLGLITREQLHRCGLTDSEIKHLVSIAAILRVHRAVYRLPGTADTLEQRALAACLACGTGAVSSHTTATSLWRLIERPSGLIEVTIPRGRRARHDGITVHRSVSLGREDVTRLGRIPITTVRRTIKDLPNHLKEEAFDTAIRDRRLTPHAFIDAKGYLGKLAKDRLGLGVPHWKIERNAVHLLRAHRLPAPQRQYWVDGYRVDLAYPEKRIAIELKGDAAHWGRERFQYDIDRSNALKLACWDEYTFTWWDITERPDHVASTVKQALSATRSPSRGARPAPRAVR